jgi:hypothetical protein
MMIRLCQQLFAVAIISFASPQPLIFAAAETEPQGPHASPPAPNFLELDIDMIVAMSGQCSTLKIAGRDFKCKAVRYFHGALGRAYFTIVVDDPNDDSHVISFSGDDARREPASLYELTIDRMMLNSRDTPAVDGQRVPQVELSTGMCKQLGDFAAGQISSVSCAAVDKNGRKYQLQFESDGTPITVQRISEYPLALEKSLARRRLQRECRHKAEDSKILPRDFTAYIIQCLGETSQQPATDERQ